ncbi:MAG: hypothetical protein KDC95_23675, partial [Planctomycetes bacterium]|nr:hypothetical protein [Planctomycetota bacterium]
FESALENFTGPFVPPPIGPYQFSGDPDHVLDFILGNNWDTLPVSPTQVATEFLDFLYPGDVTPQDDNGGWFLLGQNPFTGVWASDWYSISAPDRVLRVKNLYAYACGLTQSIVR